MSLNIEEKQLEPPCLLCLGKGIVRHFANDVKCSKCNGTGKRLTEMHYPRWIPTDDKGGGTIVEDAEEHLARFPEDHAAFQKSLRPIIRTEADLAPAVSTSEERCVGFVQNYSGLPKSVTGEIARELRKHLKAAKEASAQA